MGVIQKTLDISKEASEVGYNRTSALPVYRVGIIGMGWIGCEAPDNHLDAYQTNPRTQVVAMCDINPRVLQEFCLDYKTYRSYSAMVEMEELDLISVCTPVNTHTTIVCDCAEAGLKAIYCEKPMASTIEGCDLMIEVCEKHHTILQINHQRRFTIPKLRFSRDMIDTGTHAFDLLRHLFGNIIMFNKEQVLFASGLACDIEYISTDEHVFELDCTHNKEPMIPLGVAHLVDCLDNNKQSISSGYAGREALRLAREYKKFYEKV